MTRMTQLGFAALVLCALPAWSQEAESRDPVVAVPADVPLNRGASNSPVVVGPVIGYPVDTRSVPSSEVPQMIEAVPTMIEASSPAIQSGPPFDEIERFHHGRCYVSELGSMTNSCCMSGTCHTPECRYCSPLPQGRLARIKAHMQRSHWGYCNYFDERPLGESVYATLSQQIHRGLEDSMMLYHYDFYPEASQRAGELTPRGRTQLMKIIDRMQDHPTAIQIQITENQPNLNQVRRQHVVNALVMMGANVPEQLVVLAPMRHSGSAIEAGQIYENQLQSLILRGRTIQASGSARFGGR